MNINLTLFGQMISFVLFVVFCMRYVWPPITNALTERQKRIEDGLNAADKAVRDLDEARQQAEKHLIEAKEKSTFLVDQANKRANQILEDAKNQAIIEAERIIESGRIQLNQETTQAKEKLRQRVSELAILGAEKILVSSVDENTHREFLNQLTVEL